MAKVIMVQGTASGVGKSVLTTALCRIFKQDGYKVAPFKSQNMTTVCHELPDGRKMARSQAIAAYACTCEPSPDMNPVLLMIGADGIEVIVDGESKGVMDRQELKAYRERAFESVLAAYGRLFASNDILVIEGAGSPVELNLKAGDIINMGLAKAVNAPVVLVSDIVRGGVFASLYGTMALFEEDERALVKGIVINKFKGSIELFKDGEAILEDICGVPVLGVIPSIDIWLEDEDSLVEGEMKTKETLASRLKSETYEEYLQQEFDRVAEPFRAHLDMEKIYEILEGAAS